MTDDDVWYGPGPRLDEATTDLVTTTLLALDRPVPTPLNWSTSRAAIREAWGAVDASSDVPAVLTLRTADEVLGELGRAREADAHQTLARVLRRLTTAPCEVSELVRVIPKLICELGFSRGLISRIENDIWYPELLYVVGDPTWSQELTELGSAKPQRLVAGMHETEVVRTREPVLARNVQEEPWRSHSTLAAAARTRSYVVVPILDDAGEVVGILHGEHYAQRRDVDELDRDMLLAFAGAVGLALARAALAESLQVLHGSLTALHRSADLTLGGVHHVPPPRISRGPDEDPEGLVVQSGPRPGRRPLPPELSRRELEVLGLMAEGKANHAIAHRLGIAEGTVKQHVKHILRKLMVGSRAEAVSRWFQAG